MNDNSIHIQSRINFYINKIFYYVSYPNEIEDGIWQDRNGEYKFISEMSMEHLKSSIGLIKKNMRHYDSQSLQDISHKPVRDALFPMVEKKLTELEIEIKNRADSV